LYWLAALAGLTDVDAISLSLADYVSRGQSVQLAAVAIAIAIFSNSLVKTAMVWLVGTKALAQRLTGATLLLIAAALLLFNLNLG
jgi:uncharacterized membrane protein (DUF4010 family)